MIISQKTIILVWGLPDIGKSSIIKITRDEVIRRFRDPSHAHTFPLPTGDIHEILSFTGWRLGIESMGDDLWQGGLYDKLNKLVAGNCDIILCAMRVRNNVLDRIDDFVAQNGYRVVKITPHVEYAGPFNQDALNVFSAEGVADLIGAIVSGRL